MAQKSISGVIVEDNAMLALEELARALDIPNDMIIELVEQHIIVPSGDNPQNWRFNSVCIKRSKIAVSFQRDLEINLPGIALALDLIDKIDRLQQQLDLLNEKNK